MEERFAAFTFVDRITDFEAGRSARGYYDIPAALGHFPGTLVAEAVGQLAAWVAMAEVEFRSRPVAALARDCRYQGEALPGQRIDLEVDISHCDDESVVYRGWASVGGQVVRVLDDCLGPMLPIADFDDPRALRAHFELLCAAGATPGRFAGVPEPDLSVLEHVPGQQRRALLTVPEHAAFFADHFPRRPVFPATLLLEAGAALAAELAADLPTCAGGARAGAGWRLEGVTGIKVRSFTPPSERVEMTTSVRKVDDASAIIALMARVAGKRMANASFEFRAGDPS